MAKENEEGEQKEITPSQYFNFVKGSKKVITTEALKSSYDVFIKLAEKYHKLGQKESLRKLCFLADTLVKEEKLIEMGINTYVYKDTIEDYIENVASNTVKIVEMARYTREIPDEFVETIEKVRGIFDQIYVVFTDYTGKQERKTAKERRDKDPILFGAFKTNSIVADRFYFLGDWVDEFCDLTLDKMIAEYKEKKDCSPTNISEIPTTSEELLKMLKNYKINEEKAVQMGETEEFVNRMIESVASTDVITNVTEEKKEAVAPAPSETTEETEKAPKIDIFIRIRNLFKK